MPRNQGSVVDTQALTVRDRNGLTYPIERLEVAQGRLFYARAIAGNDLFFYQERWLIPDQGWVVNRFTFHEHLRATAIDWYMETDRVEVAGSTWRVSDGYLDLGVYDGSRYELDDADELADGIAAGEITVAEGLAALHALNTLCKALHRLHFSGESLLREYAPGLPH